MPLFVMANDIVSPSQLPSLNAICLLDCILSKVETSLKDHFIGSIVSHIQSAFVFVCLYTDLKGAVAQYVASHTRKYRVNPELYWVNNTRDLQLYIPSKGPSNNFNCLA